jgi:hypothetical protein
LLAPAQPTVWRTTPCPLSATAYSINLQLPSIYGHKVLKNKFQYSATGTWGVTKRNNSKIQAVDTEILRSTAGKTRRERTENEILRKEN